MERNIKQIVLRNLRFFLIYFFCYLSIAFLYARFITFSDLYDKFGYFIFQQSGWDENVKLWTVIAIVINLTILSSYVFKFHKNRSLSGILYVMVCIILGNIWFWVSVIPGTMVYFLSGGIMS